MNKLTPVKLSPVFKDYIWGGTKLKSVFGKKSDFDILAESWELSAHRDGQSKIIGGEFDGLEFNEYLEKIGKQALGERSARFDYFPLLIKLIDAKGDLSVQVHPDDGYAMEHEGEYGKTEMWYILGCDEGSCLYYGFNRDVSREEYENAIKNGTLTEILNRVPVKAGDVFFIPAGTVHAIGSGILICEIQQNSNTTYRVYDYCRRDKNGNMRPLHIEKALEVSSLKKSPELPEIPSGEDVTLAECEYFAVKRLRVNGTKAVFAGNDSFVSFIVTDGEGKLSYNGGVLELLKGDSVFVPAGLGEMTISGSCEIIDSRVGDKN